MHLVYGQNKKQQLWSMQCFETMSNIELRICSRCFDEHLLHLEAGKLIAEKKGDVGNSLLYYCRLLSSTHLGNIGGIFSFSNGVPLHESQFCQMGATPPRPSSPLSTSF